MIIGNIGWQPLLVDFGLQEHQLGYLYSIAAGIGIAMPFGTRLLKKYKPKNVLSWLLVVRMVLLFSIIFIYPPMFIILSVIFLFNQGFRSLKGPVLQPYIHKFVPDNIRATVISVQSMFMQFSAVIIGILAGILIDSYGVQNVISIGSLLGIIAIILYQKIKD